MKIILFILISISSLFAQPKSGIVYLNYNPVKEEAITSVIRIGQFLYFSVSSVDTVYNNRLYKSSYIIKTDLDLNVISKFKIKPTNSELFYIDRLFLMTSPLNSQEKVIGFVAREIKHGYNIKDSVSYLRYGWTDVGLSQYNVDTNKYFIYEIDTTYLPVLNVVDEYLTMALEDTLIVSVVNYHDKRYLTKIIYNQNGFFLKDTVIIPGYDLEKILKFSGENFHRLFSSLRTNTPQLLSFKIQYYPFQLVPNGNYPISYNYFSDSQPIIQDLLKSYIQDSLVLFSLSFTKYSDIVKLSFSGSTVAPDSSVFVSQGEGGFFPHYGNYLSMKTYPNLFVALPESKWEYFVNIFNWDFSWMHDTTLCTPCESNYIKIMLYDFGTLNKKWSIAIGNDAYYGVRGIKAISDSSCIVYGWRFPVGNLNVVGGDAFVWKISNGIVTSTLGASPENIATIFPNPTSDVLKITTTKSYAPTIELHSLEGKLVFRKSYGNANSFEIDISNLPGGVYLLRFVAEEFVFEEKVIKE